MFKSCKYDRSIIVSLAHQFCLNFQYGESSICDINVTRDGCHGSRQGWCGYCDKQDGDQYDLVFNVTVATNGSRVAGYRIKWISSSSAPTVLYTSYFYLTVIDGR